MSIGDVCSNMICISDRGGGHLLLDVAKLLSFGAEFIGGPEGATDAGLVRYQPELGFFETTTILTPLLIEAAEAMLQPGDGAELRNCDDGKVNLAISRYAGAASRIYPPSLPNGSPS